ncbi:MAG TPA: hypothetical protein VMW17_10280 [Candidatus Binatia bacterium]|nr:hypothetical protein [Candidatus Binatia bacterium]
MAFARVARWLGRDTVSVPLSVFLGSRLALFVLASLFIGLIPIEPDKQPGFLGAFTRWDGGWYAKIARHGYEWAGPDHASSVEFFPLFPLLAKFLSIFVGGDVALSLFLISNVAFLFYLVYLYRLAARDFDAEIAERTIVYVAIFALSVFFSAAYTESLMLALATASFFYAREGKWTRAIALGGLTSAARLSGIAVALPLAWEWYRQKGIDRHALVLLAVPSGLALYMAYLAVLTGDPVAFVHVERAWTRSFTWPWGTLRIAWQTITTLPRFRYVTAIAYVDAGCMVGFLFLLLAMIRSMPPAYWLYSAPVYFIATSTTIAPTAGLPSASIGRYLMAIFPGFIMMGVLGRSRLVHYLLLFVFAVLFGPLALYFFAKVWVE